VKLAIAHRTLPASGETRSGDAVVIRDHDGATLVAVIDVLGHGPTAAEVADQAVHHLEHAPLGRTAGRMTEDLHQALRGTRGAAAAICVMRGDRLSGCSVGNVEIRVLGSPVSVLSTPGILGQRIHRLREFEGRLAGGDRLICFSDGISSRTPFADLRRLGPGELCAVLMQQYRRAHDDATVVVADVESSS